MKETSCCHDAGVSRGHCDGDSDKPLRLGRNLAISLAVLALLFAVSFLPWLEPLNSSLIVYMKLLVLPVLLGLLLGGVIDYFVPEGFFQKYLGGSGKSSLFYAFAAGFFMSACSHGILAIAIQLYKKGASTPAVVTFLLASPWANFPVTILLVSLFGWKGFLFIVTAGGIAIFTGFVFRMLESRGYVEKNPAPSVTLDYEWERIKNFSSVGQSVRGILRGSVNLSNMVLWWIIIGLIAAVMIDVFVPENLFAKYLGPGAGGLLFTLATATVIEVCSEGSSLIAFEIYDKVGSFGNPFVFLMAGVVTDYTEIGLLWNNIGRKTALLLPAVTVPQVLFFGFLFNAFL